MPFSFSTALSGLNASTTAIGVSGNNISNANTVAFKSGSVSFQDIFADSRGMRLNGAGSPVQVGNGVAVGAIHTNFTQGGLNNSGSSTSAAIQGSGFFVVKSNQGEQSYTRAGDFKLDNEGRLVTPNGDRLQGYGAIDGVVPPGAAMTALTVPIGQTMQPVVTTTAAMRMNLDRSANAGASFHAPLQVYDSTGGAHTLDFNFVKQADGSYQVTANLDGNAARLSADGGAPAGAPVTFTFDSDGQLVTPATLSVVPDQTQLNGSALPSIEFELYQRNPDGTVGAPNITNFASQSAVSATMQDGFGAGILSGVSFNQDGRIFAVFNNGQTLTIGQIALATFNAQGAMSHIGGNLYGETIASGQPSIGAPGAGGRGVVVGGMLEQSNVDITSEFVDLIVAQRSFQANSRVISTINQTMQDLLQTI